jgi:TolB-like protein/class 3 adenylate cyclase
LSGERVERRLAAILAADVAGYSQLMGEDEAGTLARLRAHRRELIDPKVAEHQGRIVKTTGDGILIEFPSVVGAVACAVAVQQGMAERNAEVAEHQRIVFRIGINLGDVIVEDGDIHGDGVNVAARLEGIAAPGEICVSAVVLDQVQRRLDCAFSDLGEQSLKNIARPVRVYRVAHTRPQPVASGTLPRSAAEEGPAAPRPAGAGLALPDKPSIAVLPFQNMSGDPEQEYFADGMVEDITTALSKIRWFFVIARNSAFTYKGRAVDVKQVGRELGVRYVLEGSVRRGGNRLRITAQLVEAESGNHVWAERYDRDLADLFAVQDEITERVVAAIEPELYAAEHGRTRRNPPDSLDAWECVIRALSCISQGTRDGDLEAEALCRRAIAMAPDYGQAHSLLAWALMRKTFWSSDLRTVLPEARAAAERALGIDDRDAWAHLVQCILLARQRRLDDSLRAGQEALKLNPNFALGHAFLASPFNLKGEHETAIEYAERALRLSPQDRLVGAYAAQSIALAYFLLGRYEESVRWASDLIEKSPGHILGHVTRIAALAVRGDAVSAAAARDALLRLRPDISVTWVAENLPLAGTIAEKIYDALRQAGVPEGMNSIPAAGSPR